MSRKSWPAEDRSASPQTPSATLRGTVAAPHRRHRRAPTASAHSASHHLPEDLGRPRGLPGRRSTRCPGHRPPSRPRSDQPPGLHRPARARADGPATRADRGHGRPLHPDPRPRPADPRPARGRPGPPARGELPRVRHPAPRHRLAGPGHRPRHRPAAGPDPARHDHRLRRLSHGDPRGLRRPRLRHRDERGGDGPGDPVPAPAPAEGLRGPRRRPPRRLASAPRTSSSPSSPASASAAGPATSSSTPARPSAPSPWRSA